MSAPHSEESDSTVRLFIAAPIDELARKEITAAMSRFEAPSPEIAREIRWTPPQNNHLTVKFLGECPAAGVGAIAEAIRAAANSEERVAGRFTGVGSFAVFRRPTIIWTAVNDGSALASLAGKLDSSLEMLGYARERRPYFAHVTLARVRSHHAARLALAHLEHVQPELSFTLDSLILYRSELRPDGPVYSPLAAFPLRESS
ncbi:MAG TPA: RNA 2',3'-cyclic phosphodiesterase [Armatimonadota bacterium]|nr:RNA 2',3'-cyclic phosphodiesterase [Armatimonadota bacterium]